MEFEITTINKEEIPGFTELSNATQTSHIKI